VTAYSLWKTSEFISVFNEVISLEPLNYAGKNLIDCIIETLSNDQYVIVGWDRYFVQNSDDYLKNHEYHDALIYGFDSTKKILYFFDRGMNGKDFGTGVIDYESFLNAYFNGLKTINEGPIPYWGYLAGIPLSKFSVNCKEARVNLQKILYDFHVQSIGYEYLEGYHPNGEPKIYRGGIKIFDGYADLLNKIESRPELLIEDPFKLWSIKYVMENKKSHYYRFKYMFDKGLAIVDEKIFTDINELHDMLLTFFNLLTKYSYHHSKKTLLKCRELLDTIREQDKKMFSRATKIILESIKKKWPQEHLLNLNNGLL